MLFGLIIFFMMSMLMIDNAYAVTVDWVLNNETKTEINLNDLGTALNEEELIIRVSDVLGTNDSIQIEISSDDEIKLIDANKIKEGVYETNPIFFSIGKSDFKINDRIKILLDYSEDETLCVFLSECKINERDLLNIRSFINSQSTLIPLEFKETKNNNNIFASDLFQVGEFEESDIKSLDVLPGGLLTINISGRNFNSVVTDVEQTRTALSIIPFTDFVFRKQINENVIASFEVNSDVVNSELTVTGDPPGGGNGGGPSISVIVVDTPPTDPDDDSGSGCSGDCLPPTLGMDKDYNRIVDNGFSYNGNPINVELYYTPYPLITVNVGEENLTVLKIYDDAGTENIEHVGLGFGLGKGEFFNESKATINWDKTFFGAEKVTTYDPENVLDDVRITSETGKCGASVDAQCLILNIYHTFREPLDFNMVATYVWDFKRNAWQNYYNHGIHIIGGSMNPPDEYEGHYKGHKYHLTEIGKNTAVDENDNKWSLVKGIWEMDYIPTKKIDVGVKMHGFNRENARFEMYKEGQILLAEHTMKHNIMNGKDVTSYEFYESDNYFTILIKITPRSEDPVLQQNIVHENTKGKELFEKEFGIVHNKYYLYAPVDQQ